MKRKFHIIPYALKDLHLAEDAMFELVKSIGYDGIELWGVLTPEFAAKAQSRGLEIVHASLPYGEDGSVDEHYVEFILASGIRDVAMTDPTIARQMQRVFGELRNPENKDFRYKGIPGAFGSRESALRAAETATIQARLAASYGLRVFYHNHTHEYRIDHDEYVMDTYLKNTPDNVVMELDIGWALCAGVDVLAWMKKWPGRIGSLHVKPCNWVIGPEALGMTCPADPGSQGITRDHMQANQAYAESPQGPMSLNIVSWQSIFETAEAIGCSCLIHERERIYIPGDPLACIREDFNYIRPLLDQMA